MDAQLGGLLTSIIILVGIGGNLVIMLLKMRQDQADRQRAADEVARKNQQLIDRIEAQEDGFNHAMSGMQSLQLQAIGRADQTGRTVDSLHQKESNRSDIEKLAAAQAEVATLQARINAQS